MREIDETDEILEDIETLIKDPHLKESKLRKHIVGNEKVVFDSGEYYKKKDLEKKIGDDAHDEIEKQAYKMEQISGTADKKKKASDKTQVKPVKKYNFRGMISTARTISKILNYGKVANK